MRLMRYFLYTTDSVSVFPIAADRISASEAPGRFDCLKKQE